MLTQNIVKHANYVSISLQGRIDGITSPELDDLFREQINLGERYLCVNLENIHYISSVGLRVFLKILKQLKRAAGKLVIQNSSQEVNQVFTLSGFDKLFEFIEGDCDSYFSNEEKTAKTQKRIWNDIKIEEKRIDVKLGKLNIYGSTAPLRNASYEKSDVKEVSPPEIEYGCGLAALGSDFAGYASYFGEALVIDHACLVYPAQAHSAIDMMLGGTQAYNFLNGFGFNGDFEVIALLEPQEGFISINQIIPYLQEVATSDWFGVVIMGETKGLRGMNLRKVPLRQNNPQGVDILGQDTFADWMNFALEPGDFDDLVIACGLVKKPKTPITGNLTQIIQTGNEAHIHAVVFKDAILNKTISSFKSEMNTILKEAEGIKVQHLLPETCFASVLLGIIPLSVERTK